MLIVVQNVNVFYRLHSTTAGAVDRLDNVGLSSETRSTRALHHADGRPNAHPLQRRDEETKAKHNRAGVVQHRSDAGRRRYRLRRENVEHIPDSSAAVSQAGRVRRRSAQMVVSGGHRLESQLLPRRRLRVQLQQRLSAQHLSRTGTPLQVIPGSNYAKEKKKYL